MMKHPGVDALAVAPGSRVSRVWVIDVSEHTVVHP
jgi:hypothetical protein